MVTLAVQPTWLPRKIALPEQPSLNKQHGCLSWLRGSMEVAALVGWDRRVGSSVRVDGNGRLKKGGWTGTRDWVSSDDWVTGWRLGGLGGENSEQMLIPNRQVECICSSKEFDILSRKRILKVYDPNLLITTTFAHLEVPFNRKCSWKEFRGTLHTQNWILTILCFHVVAVAPTF